MTIVIDILLTLLFGILLISFSVAITSLLNLYILNSWNIDDKKPTYWDAIKKTIKELSVPFTMIFKFIKTKDESIDILSGITFSVLTLVTIFCVFVSLYHQINIL